LFKNFGPWKHDLALSKKPGAPLARLPTAILFTGQIYARTGFPTMPIEPVRRPLAVEIVQPERFWNAVSLRARSETREYAFLSDFAVWLNHESG